MVGVPSELGEEEVKAFVVAGNEGSAGPEDLIRWCARRIAAFKVPRFIEFVPTLPRSVTKGEIERHKLKARGNADAWDREAVFGRDIPQ